jgi:hypothetical protein
MIDHPSFGSEWRENDFKYVMSQEFKQKLKEQNIILTSWKEIRKALSAK